MPSSVTVDDELRRKLKKLAAELDTTQGEIILRAVSLYKKERGKERHSANPRARKAIKAAVRKRENLQWRRKIRTALQTPGPQIDEMRISNWGEINEDKSG